MNNQFKNIIVFENEKTQDKFNTLKLDGVEFFCLPEDSKKKHNDLLKIAKKQKALKAFYINQNNEIEIAFKEKGNWKFLSFEKIVATYLYSTNQKINIIDKGIKLDLLTISGEASKEIKYENNKIVISDNFDFSKIINSFFNDSWKDAFKKFEDEKHFFNIESRIVNGVTKESFENFKRDILNKKRFDGIEYRESSFDEENNVLILTNRMGKIYITFNEGKMIVQNNFVNKDQADLYYFSKGIQNNIFNNIKFITVTPPKINKKNLTLSVLGFILLICFAVITFRFVMDIDNIKRAFVLMGDANTWKQPWIYLLIINFIFSYLFYIIVSYIIEMFVSKKKPDAKRIWIYFLAAQVRKTATFITGNSFIGLFVWGWFLTKNTRIRVSSLIGSLSSVQIIRSFSIFIIAGLFMISGTVYSAKLYSFFEQSSAFWVFIAISWGGFVWAILHNIFMSMIAFMPFVHRIYNNINTRIILFKNDRDILYELENKEMSIIQVKKSYNGIFSNKTRLYRTIFLIFIPILTEALEMTYTFSLVENYNYLHNFADGVNKASYWNFVPISGTRTMISYCHHFPLLNTLPGKGLGYTELFMNQINNSIILFKHGSDFSPELAEQMGQEVTFITRFFNSYVPISISLVLSTVVMTNVLVSRIKGVKNA